MSEQKAVKIYKSNEWFHANGSHVSIWWKEENEGYVDVLEVHYGQSKKLKIEEYGDVIELRWFNSTYNKWDIVIISRHIADSETPWFMYVDELVKSLEKQGVDETIKNIEEYIKDTTKYDIIDFFEDDTE